MSNAKVFIAGSRRLSRLNKDLRRRIDNIVETGLTVVIGDANGADKAVQSYLNTKGYKNVIVFCMEGCCRNNVGDWPTQTVNAGASTRRSFSYYSIKDRVMAQEADYGLMLWDGRSRGTLTNVVHLVREGKPVVVYIAPEKSFYTLRESKQLADIVSRVDPAALQGIDRDLQAISGESGSSRKIATALLF